METKPIAAYRRELSALAGLQCAATVTYTLLREPDALCICARRGGAPAVHCMLCDIEEEQAGMLTRYLYENAVAPEQVPDVLHDLCGSAVG